MLGPVSISLGTLIVELAIFLITVFLMERLVFNPIRSAWKERERRIQEGLAAAGEGRDEIAEARAEVQRILTEARREAQQLIDEATGAGSKTRDELVTQATEEFRRLVDEARQSITAERNRAAQDLQAHIVDLALLAAGRVTGQSYNQPEVRELAASVVQREGLA